MEEGRTGERTVLAFSGEGEEEEGRRGPLHFLCHLFSLVAFLPPRVTFLISHGGRFTTVAPSRHKSGEWVVGMGMGGRSSREGEYKKGGRRGKASEEGGEKSERTNQSWLCMAGSRKQTKKGDGAGSGGEGRSGGRGGRTNGRG